MLLVPFYFAIYNVNWIIANARLFSLFLQMRSSQEIECNLNRSSGGEMLKKRANTTLQHQLLTYQTTGFSKDL